MYAGLEKGYDESYVNKWLNSSESKNSGVFERNLFNTELLFNTTVCNDKIDDITNITCDEENKENKFGLLSLYDYAKSGGKSGFINNGEDFLLSSLNGNDKYYYITSEGEVSISELTTRASGVRPVITISGDVNLLKGTGTKTSPYKIEEHEVKKLEDVYAGSIIEFSDSKYIVVDRTENSVKVALTDSLKNEEEPIMRSFGGSDSSYSNNKNTIGQYLNNDYYKSLKNNDLIVKWYIGKLSLDNLDYSNIYSSKVSLNIGMLTLGDMYVNDIKNVFTILRGIEEDKIIYVINKDGNFYGDFISSKYEIRPSFYLKGDVSIGSGEGTLDKPYKLGVNNGD